MNALPCLRWKARRSSFRPAGEVIDTRRYEVGPVGERDAKAFVLANHYSQSYPAARFRFGLYHRGQLVGVAVFSHPCSDRVLTSVFPGEARESVELGRFVLLDEVPSNGETFFLGRAFALLRREGLRGVVSFSDPLPRVDAAGNTVFPGHLGVIYQAHNAVFLGRGTPRTLRLLPDGRVLSDRSLQKIRKQERGWEYSSGILEAAGADPLRGSPAAWLSTWLPRLTRTVRHPGNFKYCWELGARRRWSLPPSLPYPKRKEAV